MSVVELQRLYGGSDVTTSLGRLAGSTMNMKRRNLGNKLDTKRKPDAAVGKCESTEDSQR